LPRPPPRRVALATIVIVFKDGHRQAFNLSEIVRVEFPAGGDAAAYTSDSRLPSRSHFLGKWEVGDGSGGTFYITIYDDGNAMRSMAACTAGGSTKTARPRVTWDDGPHDAIRKVGSRYQKFAYVAGKSFTEIPDNVTKPTTRPRIPSRKSLLWDLDQPL